MSEITVHLDDATIDKIAVAIAAKISGSEWPVTQSNPPQPESQRTQNAPVSAPQSDPWTNQSPPQQEAPQYSYGAPPRTTTTPPPPAANVPTCVHGVMRFVPAGFSKATGKPYPSFYGCPAPRGAQDKCRSVPAEQ